MSEPEAFGVIVAEIRQELAAAAETLMGVYEAGVRDLARVRDGDDAALSRMEGSLSALLEVCAFEDLIGQRLTQLQSLPASASTACSGDDALLNGPARQGQGLDQAAADAVFASKA